MKLGGHDLGIALLIANILVMPVLVSKIKTNTTLAICIIAWHNAQTNTGRDKMQTALLRT